MNKMHQKKWCAKIMGYGYHIEYKTGRESGGRCPFLKLEDVSCAAISMPIPDWWKDILQDLSL